MIVARIERRGTRWWLVVQNGNRKPYEAELEGHLSRLKVLMFNRRMDRFREFPRLATIVGEDWLRRNNLAIRGRDKTERQV